MTELDFLPHIPDDTNKLLLQIQGMVFPQEANRVFNELSRKYINAIKLVGIKTNLYHDLMDHKIFKPNPFWFEYVYNHIAAYYRYQWDDHGQIPLPFPGTETYQEILRKKWLHYLEWNLENFLEKPNMSSTVLSIFIYSDSEEGRRTFEKLLSIIQMEYPLTNVRE